MWEAGYVSGLLPRVEQGWQIGNGARRSCNDRRKLFLVQVEILPLWKFRPVNTLIIPVANPARRASAPLRRPWQLAEPVAGGTSLTAHGVPEHGHTVTAQAGCTATDLQAQRLWLGHRRTVISRRPHTVRPVARGKITQLSGGPHCLAPDADIILASQGLPLGFSSRALEPDPPYGHFVGHTLTPPHRGIPQTRSPPTCSEATT